MASEAYKCMLLICLQTKQKWISLENNNKSYSLNKFAFPLCERTLRCHCQKCSRMTTLLIKHYLNNNEWNFFHKSRRIRFKSTAYIDTKCNYSHNNQILSYIRSIILDYTPNHFERQNNILPKIFRTKLFSAKADVYDSLIHTLHSCT